MWPQLIDEILVLENQNMSKIARFLGVSAEAVRKLKHGLTRDPHFAIGERLFALHFNLRPDRYIISEKKKTKKSDDKN